MTAALNISTIQQGLHTTLSLFLFPFVKAGTQYSRGNYSTIKAWLATITAKVAIAYRGTTHRKFMKDNSTKMKCVSLPLDVFGKFRSVEPELAGEVLQYVLNYVIDGEQKHFNDPYKEMLFESLLEPIRPQMARYSERAEQCQEMARERKKSQKSSRKKNGNVSKDNENADVSNVAVADNHKNVVVADDNVTSTYDNVQSEEEDVSFATFMSIYEHLDKGGFDTESVWNRLTDEEKRDAIRFTRSYVKQIPDATKREWPSKFLSSRPWAQISNQ